MLTIIYNNVRLKVNLKKLFKSIFTFALMMFLLSCVVDFMRFPDKYITTWKYQLQNEISQGRTESIDYYKANYTDKGVCLFGED
nr:MAG TPA: mature oligodendrocyte transmembrane protein [Caudoviricetes sp.]